jgi:hypothetical protein
MHRSYSVAAVLALTVLALSLPFSLAIATSAFGQEQPEPPTGGPQNPPPDEPQPPEPPDQPGVEQPGTGGGQLPRTGWDALLYLALGVALLLGGARLRVLTRIREVVQRVRRRSTEAALREALEPIRAARLGPPEPDPDPGPLHVEPSTLAARRRMAGVGQPDDSG